MSPDEFQGPLGLSGAFLWIGIGLIALIFLVLGLMLWFTRKAGLASATAEPLVYGRSLQGPGEQIYALRQEYQEHISRVELLYLDNRLDDREAHQELSYLIRSFAEARAGEPVTHATLAEMRKLPISKSLGDLIEYFYTPAFGPEGAGKTIESIEAARKVVSRW